MSRKWVPYRPGPEDRYTDYTWGAEGEGATIRATIKDEGDGHYTTHAHVEVTAEARGWAGHGLTGGDPPKQAKLNALAALVRALYEARNKAEDEARLAQAEYERIKEGKP